MAIVDNGKYYLYRHIRLDKNQPFYIGIGKKTSTDIKRDTFSRAYSNKYRNRFWEFVTKKTNFLVEILVESNDREFIQKKEIYFINLYGRQDKGSGNLCNLTDGGDNGLNRSSFSIKKQLGTAKKNGTYQQMVDRIKTYAPSKGSNRGYLDKKTFLYNTKGEFLSEFKNREECGKFINKSGSKVTRIITSKASSCGYIVTDFKVSILDISQYKISRSKNKPINQVCNKTGCIVNTFNSLTEAAKSIGSIKNHIWFAMKKGYTHKGYKWQYIN